MIFLGREIHEQRDYSEKLLEKLMKKQKDILQKHKYVVKGNKSFAQLGEDRKIIVTAQRNEGEGKKPEEAIITLKVCGIHPLTFLEKTADMKNEGKYYATFIWKGDPEEPEGIKLAELMKIKGIGLAKASTIQASFELNKRINSGKLPIKKVKNSSDIAKYYMEKMKDLKKEHLIAVFLDSKNKIIKDEVISIGTLDSSLVHPREVFKEAIKNSASSMILIHNHPSGDPTPSEEDLEITRKMMEVGEELEINVLDHVIIGDNNWWSWKERALE